MDGMLTKVVGVVRVDDGPRPFATSDALARQAVGQAHARAVADQARAMASLARPSPTFHIPVAFNPDAAARAAERARVQGERRRVLMADKLLALRDAGRLSREEYEASREMAELLEWAEAGRQVMARSQFRERMAASSGEALATQHRLEEADRLRFQPWRVWANAKPVRPGVSIADLTFAMVVDRLGLRQTANAYAMDQRRVEDRLRLSLAVYAASDGKVPSFA